MTNLAAIQENILRAKRAFEIKKRTDKIEQDIISVVKEEIEQGFEPSNQDLKNYIEDEHNLDTELNAILNQYGDQKEFYRAFADVSRDKLIERMIKREF